MSDDQGIVVFMGVGVAVLAVIVVIGILSSRRKRKSGEPLWSSTVHYLGVQPYIASSNMEIGDKQQWALFQARYPLAATIEAVPVLDGDEEGQRTLHVSRIKRSLRAGWPTAKIGYSAYFHEYEGTDLPASFDIEGTNHVTRLLLDSAGITGVDLKHNNVWASPWASLQFSNGPELVLKAPSGVLRINRSADPGFRTLEELVIKYGTFTQMHF